MPLSHRVVTAFGPLTRGHVFLSLRLDFSISQTSCSDRYTLLYIEQLTNKDLLHSTGNTAQCSVIT